MTSWKPRTIEELIAALPWEAGYQLRDGDVAVLGITEDGTPGLCAPIITNQLDMEHTADALTHGEQMLARTGHPHMVTVAYGGVSAEQALTAHATQLGRDIELAESLRVEYGELYGSKSPTREAFVNVGQVPDVSEQMRLRGFSDPVGDRNLMLEGLTPNDQQQVQSLEPNAAAAIEELMPGAQVQQAVTGLYEQTYDHLQDGHRDSSVAVLSHCVAQNVTVRDAVVLEASRTPETTSVLIEAYKRSPEQQRLAMGVCAGMANFMRGGSSQATGQLVTPALSHPEQGRGAHLTYNAAAAGISGPDAAAALEANIEEAIESADLDWRSLHGKEYLYTTRQRLEEEQYVTTPAGPGW